jgi:hypothetical protein
MPPSASILLLHLLLSGLVAGLGHDDFRTREAASAELATLEQAAHPWLRQAQAKHEDPEVRARAKRLLEDWRNGFRPTSYPLTPWLDMLPDDFADRQATLGRCLDGAREAVGWSHPGSWGEYRHATALLIDELIDAGWTLESVRELLDAMATREKAYLRRLGLEAFAPLLTDQLP